WCVEELFKRHTPELSRLRGQVDLLAGGPPCQGFSSAGRRRAVDPRNELVERYLELIDMLRPRIVLVENVLGITYDFKVSGEKGGTPLPNFADRIKTRLGENYHVFCSTLRACEFGVPQYRPRFFLIAVLKSESPGLILFDPFNEVQRLRDEFLAERGFSRRVT